MKSWISFAAALAASLAFAAAASAQQALSIKPLAEKKVRELPAGPLFWRIENFSTLSQAEAAATPWSLVAQADGKVWLFTLGAKGSKSDSGGSKSGSGNKVGEVGPIPRLSAPEYLLRINEARGAPGSRTAVHTHPGSEAFFVLAGEQSIRSPQGEMRVKAGQAEAGQGGDTAMLVSSAGSTDLHALVMFVVDATRPFSSPATMP